MWRTLEASDVIAVVGCISLAIGVLVTLYVRRNQKLKAPFLDKTSKRVEILDVKELSQDTKRIRLGLGHERQFLGLPTGKHIQVCLPNPKSCLQSGLWNGKPDADKGKADIFRSYTPVTGNETRGYCDLVIKVYKAGDFSLPDGRIMTWEDGGKSSQYLHGLKVGDFVEIKGPTGVHEYLGRGKFKVPGRTLTVSHVGMMAGGSGLTPMLQIVQASLQDKDDKTKFTLLYANKRAEDILCQDLLEEVEKSSNGRFRVHYTLDFPPEGWKGEAGFITADMISRLMPAPSETTAIAMCGPPPMIEFACKRNLTDLGYEKSSMMAW